MPTTTQQTMWKQRYREKKKSLGLCIYGGCNRLPVGNLVHCSEHRKSRERLCRYNHCAKIVAPRKIYCTKHRVIAARETMRNKERKLKKRRREYQLANGLCGRPYCTRVSLSGKTLCEYHREKSREANKKARLKHRRLADVSAE